ncbi:hypothetical protein ACFL4W_05090, partial [Planctomycetota bacterium]
TYHIAIAPRNSGTAAKRITYRAYKSEKAIVTDSRTGRGRDHSFAVWLRGKSYITIQGIHFTHMDRYVYVMDESNYNTIAHCIFDKPKLVKGKTASWGGSKITGNSRHNRIHHCTFSGYGSYDADDNACVIDIGNEGNTTDTTGYNLIEHNAFYHGGHHVMGVYSMYNVIRHNHFHNEPWSMGTPESDRGAVMYGDRNLSFGGYIENSGRNLFEYNRVGYAADPSDNHGASGVSLNSSRNIVRCNAFFGNICAGLSMSVTRGYKQSILENKIYHNAFSYNGWTSDNWAAYMKVAICVAIYNGPHIIKDNVIKNNAFFQHRTTFGEYNINTPDRKGLLDLQKFANNWLDKQGDPRFRNAKVTGHDPKTYAPPGAPMDYSVPDLILQASSPCRNKGVALTTITSQSGSGTTFAVEDAGYFMDGWGIHGVQGDKVRIFGTSQQARIVKADYSTDTITLDSSVKWAKGQGLTLSYEGPAPDIGILGPPPAGTPAPAEDKKKDGKLTAKAERAKPRKPKPVPTGDYDPRLIKRLIEETKAGRDLKFYLETARSNGRVTSVNDKGDMQVSVEPEGIAFAIKWSRLTLKERANLALAVLRKGTPADHELVAFYMLAAGDKRGAAGHVRRAGKAGALLQARFK